MPHGPRRRPPVRPPRPETGATRQVAAAFAAGEISLRHVQAITDAYTAERADAFTAAEGLLVDVARDHTPKELAAVVRCMTDAIDGDGGAGPDQDDYAARRPPPPKLPAGKATCGAAATR
jgi:hypothetical protein